MRPSSSALAVTLFVPDVHRHPTWWQRRARSTDSATSAPRAARSLTASCIRGAAQLRQRCQHLPLHSEHRRELRRLRLEQLQLRPQRHAVWRRCVAGDLQVLPPPSLETPRQLPQQPAHSLDVEERAFVAGASPHLAVARSHRYPTQVAMQPPPLLKAYRPNLGHCHRGYGHHCGFRGCCCWRPGWRQRHQVVGRAARLSGREEIDSAASRQRQPSPRDGRPRPCRRPFRAHRPWRRPCRR